MSEFEKIQDSDVPRSNKGRYANRAWLDSLADNFRQLAAGEALRFTLDSRYSSKGDGWTVSLRRAMQVRGIDPGTYRLSRPGASNKPNAPVYIIRLV